MATFTDNGGGAPNGSDLEFTYTFPVIQTEDVKVALNGVTQSTTKYAVDNVSNPTKITFNNTSVDSSVQNTSGAPKSGVRVRVYRETTVGKANGDEDPKAVFAAGSSIRAIDLNANQEQSLMAIHELQTRPVETEDIQAHHLTIIKGNGGMARKTDDNYVVPLCAICHHYLHWLGERSFWIERKLEPTIYAALLWDSFQKTQGKRV